MFIGIHPPPPCSNHSTIQLSNRHHQMVKRSRIHGWGLFAKVAMKKDELVAEYLGEVVRSCVADLREKLYEVSLGCMKAGLCLCLYLC